MSAYTKYYFIKLEEAVWVREMYGINYGSLIVKIGYATSDVHI